MRKNMNLTRTLVKVIKQNGEALLVQYTADGLLERKYIPALALGDGNVLDEVLEQGIPFGYPWQDIETSFNSLKFANELHQLGVWTVEDALKNPKALWSALNATYAENINVILEAALSEKKRSK